MADDRVAENAPTVPDVIAAHQRTNEPGNPCICGRWPTPARGLGWHEHVTIELAPLLGDLVARARADVLRDHADREVAHEGYTMAVERLLAHAHEHDGYLTKAADPDDTRTAEQAVCPACGPTTLEQHPRRPGVARCVNCKEHLRSGENTSLCECYTGPPHWMPCTCPPPCHPTGRWVEETCGWEGHSTEQSCSVCAERRTSPGSLTAGEG